MLCLDTSLTVAFVVGALPAAERARAEHHLAACDRCRRMVSEAAREPSRLGRITEVGFSDAAGAGAGAPQPGDRVGQFHIRGVLGKGGMGVVYDAFDEQLQRPVALKAVRPRAPGGAPAPAHWIAEARALARLDHPNVVTLYEVVPHGGGHFLALERVDGVTLRGWLRERRRTVEEILEVFAAAAHGLSAAHAAGIVHRDFKPDNVLVGRDGRVRVADFGLATPEAREPPLLVGGTPRYVAPEQARGEPPDARSDQYSFAVALVEALGGATAAAALTSGAGAKPMAWARLPRGLEAVVTRALAARPGDRFPSVAALVAALAGARRRHLRRRRLTLVAAVASVLIGATAHGQWRAHLEALASEARLEAARRTEAQRAHEAALLLERHAAMTEEAAALRTRQSEAVEEAAALRAQIASLVPRLLAADGQSARERDLRRALRARESQLRVLARAMADREHRDDSPSPMVVEQRVRRLAAPLRVCFSLAVDHVRLPSEPGAELHLSAHGAVLWAVVRGVPDQIRRDCVERVLLGLRVPPFSSPEVRAYNVSLSWLRLEALMPPRR
jgi:serine/threonine-protein kinase